MLGPYLKKPISMHTSITTWVHYANTHQIPITQLNVPTIRNYRSLNSILLCHIFRPRMSDPIGAWKDKVSPKSWKPAFTYKRECTIFIGSSPFNSRYLELESITMEALISFRETISVIADAHGKKYICFLIDTCRLVHELIALWKFCLHKLRKHWHRTENRDIYIFKTVL